MLGASDLQIQENVTAEQMRLNGVLEKYMAMPEEEWKTHKTAMRSLIAKESPWGGARAGVLLLQGAMPHRRMQMCSKEIEVQ